VSVTIDLERGASAAPNARLRGQVSWKLDAAPASARLRLIHVARGGGVDDEVTVVRDVDVATLSTATRGDPYRGRVSAAASTALDADEARAFELELPASPYSFTGRLVSIAWSLEVVLEPGGVEAAVELVLSPTGATITAG